MAHVDENDEEWIEDDGDGDELLVCPSCRGEVHEDTQQCPHCGEWIIPAYLREHRRLAIWGIAVVLLILAMILFTVF